MVTIAGRVEEILLDLSTGFSGVVPPIEGVTNGRWESRSRASKTARRTRAADAARCTRDDAPARPHDRIGKAIRSGQRGKGQDEHGSE
jgi:hypothetical protein